MTRQFTAITEREGNGYVSLCQELDIASQGETIEQARENLREALELFFECVSPEEINTRLHDGQPIWRKATADTSAVRFSVETSAT